MELTGDDTPEAGSEYVIHVYNGTEAVTVYTNGSVGLDAYDDSKSTQRFTCVGGEDSDPLGFKCTSCGQYKNKTKYLGFTYGDILQCDADEKNSWEYFWTDDAWGGGFKVKMKKDDKRWPLEKQSNRQLKMQESSSLVFGFTKCN